jgi:hypothetical protein
MVEDGGPVLLRSKDRNSESRSTVYSGHRSGCVKQQSTEKIHLRGDGVLLEVVGGAERRETTVG